jgi:hypothetical protein
MRWLARAKERVTVGSKPSGTSAHGHTDREQEALARGATQQQGDQEEDPAYADGDHGHQAHHTVQRHGQGTGGRVRGLGQVRDLGQPRPAARRDDLGHRLALDHERPCPRGPTGAGLHQGALARQHRLVQAEFVTLGQTEVGTHPVTAGEQHDVADDEVGGIDDMATAITTDRHPHREQAAQPRRGPVRAELLGEREQPVEHHDHGDRDSQRRHAGDERERGSDPEHQREEVGHLRAQQPHRRGTWWLGQGVRPVPQQPFSSIPAAEPAQPFRRCLHGTTVGAQIP